VKPAAILQLSRQWLSEPIQNTHRILNLWWGTGVVICLKRGADLHMAQLMPLPLTVSCSSKIQIGFTFPVVPAYPGCPGKEAVKWLLLLLLLVSGIRRMNEVNARRAWLVLGRVTVFGRVYRLRM